MESTMQEVTKAHTVSGIIRELDMALTANNIYELFRIRVINASGHSAQLVANILSPAEASLSCFTISHCCSSALQKLLLIWKRKLLPSMLPEVQYTISQKNQCEAIHLGICHVAFLLLPGTFNVFLNTLLNCGQPQPGMGRPVAVLVSPVAGSGAF